jgi:transcriptional regulator with XRE-family HTH domain
MSDLLKLVGARIRDLRKERGMSQEALGEKAGFHYSYVGSVERGERNISLGNLDKIGESLGIDVAELFNYVQLSDNINPKETRLSEIIALLARRDDEELRMVQRILTEILIVRGRK